MFTCLFFRLPVTIPDPTVNDTEAWILINIRQVGYFRVLYDTETWHALIGQLNKDHTVCIWQSEPCCYHTHARSNSCARTLIYLIRTHTRTQTRGNTHVHDKLAQYYHSHTHCTDTVHTRAHTHTNTHTHTHTRAHVMRCIPLRSLPNRRHQRDPWLLPSFRKSPFLSNFILWT